jgi:hypothetical protein
VSGRERFIPPNVSEGLARSHARARADGAKHYGPVVRVDFPAAAANRAVAHGLTVTPDGFEHARCTGAVFEVDWTTWTAEVAYLRAPVANTLAVGRFFAWQAPTPEEGV